MNIICFNLPESNKESSEERKTEDIDKFCAICGALDIDTQTGDIKLAFRLGNRMPGPFSSIWPLKLILEIKKMRREIIDKAKQIKEKAPTLLKRLVIVKDLTPTQQANNRKKERSAAGNWQQ